jgi:hypothetical protein
VPKMTFIVAQRWIGCAKIKIIRQFHKSFGIRWI